MPSFMLPDVLRPIERQPPQRLNRTLYLLVLASFFLPFAMVRSCAGDEGVSHTGIALLQEDAGALLIGVLLLAVLLFVFSFRSRVLTTLRQGLVSASKALLCALAIMATVLAAGIPFLFSQVSVQIGFFFCVGSWFVLFLLSMRMAIHLLHLVRRDCREQPPPWGLAVGIVVLAVDLLTVSLSQPNDLGEAVLGVLASILLAAPMILMAMLLAVRHRLVRVNAAASGLRAER